MVTFGIMQPWRILSSSSNCNVKKGQTHSSMFEISLKFYEFNNNSIQGIKQEPIVFLFNYYTLFHNISSNMHPIPCNGPSQLIKHPCLHVQRLLVIINIKLHEHTLEFHGKGKPFHKLVFINICNFFIGNLASMQALPNSCWPFLNFLVEVIIFCKYGWPSIDDIFFMSTHTLTSFVAC